MSFGTLDFNKTARSIGLLVDRCMRREQPFATVCLIGDMKAITCAHSVVLYQNALAALKVQFPYVNQQFEISEVTFHPRFDLRAVHELAIKSLSVPVPALALQDHNVAILTLSRNVSELSAEIKTEFNKKLAIPPVARVKGLSGSVDDLGLALVIQTMTNARKDGCLVISDERNRPLAKLFCRDGRVIFAKYGNLLNEPAVYQMFADQISGQFSFQSQVKPDWDCYAVIERQVDSMLLEAHRRMDETPRLLSELGGEGTYYKRAAEIVNIDVLSPEVQQNVDYIWSFLDGGVSIDQLWEIVSFDSFAVYSTLVELYRTRQLIELPGDDDSGLSPLAPFEMAPHLLLSPWDDIVSVNVHPRLGKPQLRQGNLVGLIRPNDPWHILHSLSLPYRASGSPIFKNGHMVGMHCGLLPLDPKLYALSSSLSQMLWVESIQQMLNHKGGEPGVRPSKKSLGMKLPDLLPAAGRETAKVQCPKCSSWMVKHARFCGTCGQLMGK